MEMIKIKIWKIISNNVYTIGFYKSYEKAEMYCINEGYAKISNEYFLKINSLMCETLNVKEIEITKEIHPFVYLLMTKEY
jgi:hypothetical protein